MSINLLAILGGITGITGVATAPVTSLTSSAKSASLLQIEDSFGYKVRETQETGKFEIKVKKLSQTSEVYGLKTFPIAYTETLMPDAVSRLDTPSVWDHAENFKKQAETNKWEAWGYNAVSLFATGEGTNGIVLVEAQIAIPPLLLKPYMSDLNAVAHGTPTISSNPRFKSKVIVTEDGLAVQMYYINLKEEAILIIESNPMPSEALGTVIDFFGNVATSYFHN